MIILQKCGSLNKTKIWRYAIGIECNLKKVLCSAEKSYVIWAKHHSRSSAQQFGQTERLVGHLCLSRSCIIGGRGVFAFQLPHCFRRFYELNSANSPSPLRKMFNQLMGHFSLATQIWIKVDKVWLGLYFFLSERALEMLLTLGADVMS